MTIVMNWVKHMIYNADAFAPTFLTDFLQASLLGFGQDPQGTLEAIRQAPYSAHYFCPPAKLVRKDYNISVMCDLARYFDKSDLLSVSSGVMFFQSVLPVPLITWSPHLSFTPLFRRHVVTTMLPMKMSLACEMAEDICATFVVLMRPRLHGITLPRSWLLKVLRHGHPRGHTHLHGVLIESILMFIGKVHASLDAGEPQTSFGSDCDCSYHAWKLISKKPSLQPDTYICKTCLHFSIVSPQPSLFFNLCLTLRFEGVEPFAYVGLT